MATITCNYSGSPITTSWYSSHSGAGLEVTGVTYNTDTGKLSISWRMYLREDGSHYNFIAGYASIGGTQVAWDHAGEWGTYWTWDNWSNNKTFKSGTLTANWASSFGLYCKAMFNYGYTDARWNNGTGCVDGSGTLYVSLPSYWNDINAWNPDQSAQHGLIFNLTTSDGGSWTDITNEPSSSEFTKPYGTTATISNIRSNITGAHYSGNSLASGTGDPISWTFTTANYAVQLYTAWDTYSIAYAPNGGSSTPTTQTKTYGVNLTLANAISRANGTQNGYTVTFDANTGSVSPTSKTATDTVSYSFSSWKDGQGDTYSGGGTYTKNQANTLTAQWSSSIASRGSIVTPTATKANGTATRTVTFNATANGGTCSTPSLNSTATITYTGNGWYTATSGGTQRATNGGTYTPSASETVHQQWSSSTGSYSAVTLPAATKANGSSTRTVTFDATTNGGTCSTSTLDSTATITYSQTGWWTASSGGTNRGNSGSTYTPSAAETVYAQFSSTTGTYSAITLPAATKANSTSTRTVTFNANQGTTTKASQNSTATVTYSQTGWWTAASGGTNRGNSGATYTPSTSEKIYAQFSSSTGSYSAVTLPTATECTRNGYVLLGWATTDSATTATYAPGASYTPSATIILYAVWQLDQATVWYKEVLPGEYQAVEYIESTGTQYIDTGVLGSQSDRLCITFSYTALPNAVNNLFGTREAQGAAISAARISEGNKIAPWFGQGLDTNVTIAVNTKYTIDTYYVSGKQEINVNGELKKTGTITYTYADTNTNYLFSLNDNGTAAYKASMRLYSCKMFKDDKLIRYFIPCYHKQNNTIGLYDIVNNTFYSNVGTGTFNKGIDGNWIKGKVWIKKPLPTEYQEVEYIESTGGQWINTNYIPNYKTDIYCKLAHNESTIDTPVFGCRNGNYTNSYVLWSHPLEYNSGATATIPIFNSLSKNLSNYTQGTVIEFNYNKNGGTYGQQTWTWAPGSGSPSVTLALFTIKNGENPDGRKFSGKMWYFKIYEDGMLIHDYVPCYRVSDNVAGLYDTMENVFYPSLTGSFTKGPDVTAEHWFKAKKFYAKQSGSWIENKTTA